MQFKYLFYVLLTLCSMVCWAQNGSVELLNFRTLTEENGLPSNNIHCFAKDQEGYMWIGTSNGLVRYDGSEVLVFQNDPQNPASISGNQISALTTQGDSIMWVATRSSGLNKLHLKTRTFTQFIPRQDVINSIPSREVYALKHDSHGDLWVGYNREGFGRFDPKTASFEQIKITSLETSFSNRQNNVVKDFIIDKTDPNKLWVITLRSLIEYQIESGTLIRHNPYHASPSGIESRLLNFEHAIQSTDGQIYLACIRYGVWVYNPAENTWKNYSEKRVDPTNRNENSFNLIAEIDTNTFWLSSKKRGVHVLNIATEQISPFEIDDDRNTGFLASVNTWKLKSAEGYWFGSENGVKLFNKQGNQFDIYEYKPQAKWLLGRQSISAIYPINGDEIYFGGYAGEGIYRYHLTTGNIRLIRPPQSIEKSEAKMFFLRDFVSLSDTALLVLAYDGLYKLNLKTEKLTVINTGLKFGRDYNTLNRILRHSDGSYLISTGYSGVFVLDSLFQYSDHLKSDILHPTNSLVSSSYIYEICEDTKANVWIGTEDGFSRWNPYENTFLNFDYKSRRDSVPGLKSLYSISLAPDSSLWFIDAYKHGVSLDYPYEMPYQFKPILTGNEGRKDRINNFLFSRSGKTIFLTESGLSIASHDGSFKLFTDKEGLPKTQPLTPLVEMPDGRIVLAAGNKVVSFFPDSLDYTPKKNELHLSSITIFDKVLHTRIDSIMNHGLELNYLQNFFTLNFSLLNFDNPGEYRVSYRLKGFSDEWITSKAKSAVFTNVPGGKYNFEARLIDQNDRLSKATLVLPIRMVPPVWQTWWFRTLLATSLFTILISIIVVRFRTVRRKAAYSKELANMEMISLRSQMNPHFIFNSLSSIRHQIISEKNEEAEKYLVKFSRLIRWILESSESHYITLEDELMALRLYLELESKRFDHKFEYRINIDPGIDPSALNVPGIIMQPFVENAIWHGLMQKKKPGTVIINISKTEQRLIIVITDDGIGREKAHELKSKTGQSRNSMGVKITTARLDVIRKLYNISCSADIEDLKNETGEPTGTRVTINLPLIHVFTNKS